MAYNASFGFALDYCVAARMSESGEGFDSSGIATASSMGCYPWIRERESAYDSHGRCPVESIDTPALWKHSMIDDSIRETIPNNYRVDQDLGAPACHPKLALAPKMARRFLRAGRRHFWAS